MADETKQQESAPKSEDWEQAQRISFSTTFHVATGPRIYVVKVPGGYMRVPSAGGALLGVRSVRLATRLDSALWAKTLAQHCPGSKVVRLVSKAEREAEKLYSTSATGWDCLADGSARQRRQGRRDTAPVWL